MVNFCRRDGVLQKMDRQSIFNSAVVDGGVR